MGLAEALWQLAASAAVPLLVGVYVGRRAADAPFRARVSALCRPIVWIGWVPVLLAFQATLPGIGAAGIALRLHQAIPGLGLPEVALVLRLPLLSLWLSAFTALVTQRYARGLAIQVGEWPGDRGAMVWPAAIASISGASAGLLLLLLLWVAWVSLGYRVP